MSTPTAAEAAAHNLLMAVQHASLSKKTGAHVTLDAATGDVVVLDCPQWTKDNFTLLRLLSPEAEVSVHPSATSLSGFAIVVRTPAAPAVGRRLAVAAGCLLALFALGGREGVFALAHALAAWWACGASSSS